MTGPKKFMKEITFSVVLLLLWVPTMVSCGDNQDSIKKKKVAVKSESFTFLDLGTNTRLSNEIRDKLGEELGRDAIERHGVLNLNTIYEGFIEKNLPQISDLNREINSPSGERVEHDIVRLMYRYPRKQGAPFDYVELVFSGYTQTPLVFKVNFKKDETGIVDTLKSKYGPPKRIDWQNEDGESMIWRKNEDLMIVSQVPDQFIRHGYEIAVYFVRNLQEYIEIERDKKANGSPEGAQSGGKAF